MNDESVALETVLPAEGVSAEAVEQQMVQKALEEDPSGTPADKAAAFFKRSVNELEGMLGNMSRRGLERMILHAATYPYLGKEYAIKKDSIEFKASYRFNEMINYKTVMQLQHEMQKAEKAMAEGNVEHSLTKQGLLTAAAETNQENNNGSTETQRQTE